MRALAFSFFLWIPFLYFDLPQAKLSDFLRPMAPKKAADKNPQNKPSPQETINQETINKVSKKTKHKPPPAAGRCTKELVMEGAIGPASLDSLQHALRKAEKDKCTSLLLLVNTPGGNLLSTRKIVETMLDSSLPVLCLVHPSGAHAGSAGAIILQACHVNGAVTATNIGAATPILGAKETPSDLRKKLVNDTSSWLDSLTTLRKRNKKFGRDIVQKAKAVEGQRAHKIGAIDFYGASKEEFLKFSHGRIVQLGEVQDHVVQVGEIQSISRGFRHYITHFITDPEMVYLLFVGSLLLIYFEVTHPGTLVPGVLGGIGLVLSLTGMHKLNFVWGGLILILLGIVLMILEAFTSSFGVLGVFGGVAFVLGSFFLFDPVKTGGLMIPYGTIIVVSLIFITLSMGLAYLAYSSLKKKRKSEEESWLGLKGMVVEVQSDQEGKEGLMEIKGEVWKYKSQQLLQKGDSVKITKYHDDMFFEVEKTQAD